MQKYDTNSDGNLSLKEVKNVSNITITPDDNVNDFFDFYNLVNLNSITFDGVSLTSLDGLGSVPVLKNLIFQNTTVESYDELSKCSNLESLKFIINSEGIDGNEEMKKLCGTAPGKIGISSGNFDKIDTLAICGGWNSDRIGNDGFLFDSSNINDLSCLTNISKSFKSTLKRLFIHNNKLEGDLSFLVGFSGVKLLNVSYNNITTLKGIKNFTSLEELYIFHLINLGVNDDLIYSNENNSLFELQFCENLKTLDIVQDADGQCKLLSYIKNCKKLSYLRLFMNSFDMDDIISMKDFLWSLDEYHLGSRYSLALLSNDTTELRVNDQNIDVDEFMALKNHPGLKFLGFHYTKLMRNGVEIKGEEFTNIFSEVVGSLSKLECIDCCGTELINLDFIRNEEENKTNTPNLKVLNILNTSITDLSNIQYVKLEGLGINNSNINLLNIENYLGNIRKYGYLFSWIRRPLFAELKSFLKN